MGVVFGLLMGSFDHSVSMSDEYHRSSNRGNVDAKVVTWPRFIWHPGKIRMTLRDMGARSRSYGKNFAAVGLIYSAVECFIEKVNGFFQLTKFIAEN